ncbi:hemin transporter [Pelistega indica]|uniref:Hemin transporter n=1 Tax=Pelistega indica TaxID=1414851 RepID=V8G9B9_9BURK|nr:MULTISPECIES: hemin-degrading factor [Pelistega]ETD72307.1 hemin transporter [Pelistega indica]
MDLSTLKEQAQSLLTTEPHLRIKNVADKLGVSERDLVQAECCGVRSVFLGTQFREIFRRLGELGHVMALTRNPWCVHEKQGNYEKISVGKAPVGLVLGADIDLRLFLSNWQTVWAVSQDSRHSIQFFDKAGVAIHKVYLTEKTNNEAFHQLIADFTSSELVPPLEDITVHHQYTSQAPSELRDEWLSMQDTHDFFPLLQKWNIHRLTALASAGNDLAQKLENPTSIIEKILTHTANTRLPIMCFVGNPHLIQIHTGPIQKLLRTGPWFNVLDPTFNLHLNTNDIASAWVVNKPSQDGWVTSLELYEKGGEMIAQFFGARKPGNPELPEWRQLMLSICSKPLKSD